ncbi:MAG: TlpA disulfide reductase family protein [Dehalococcoidales bacterium]|nr:TlpA disulfide reductase family protein [Dehalococcoidales bacterium]
MKKKILTLLTVMIASVLLLTGCGGSGGEKGNTVGKIAYDFQLEDTFGNQVNLSDFLGKPVLLNFWATWCDSCQLEMLLFQKIYEDENWSKKDLVILAVNLQEDSNNVKQFLAYFGYTFTVLLDINGSVSNRYNVRGIPVTYLIDKDGIIKDVLIGAFSSILNLESKLALITD